ncbi:protein-L-isoaspartate(D-aspartate) O-methyltransferase [candidate division GN15 bacterium]|nr:protein-L-isoaspartate(D-aspartate) O-methyltransferase [candidate division GN15 bacterium]
MTDELPLSTEEEQEQRRFRMVAEDLAGRDIDDEAVLDAMRTVPRHLFVPERLRDRAYADGPLPIGEGQTISQPYVVASMTQHLNLSPSSKVLEIGTGSGYQAAVLAEIVADVYSVEVIPELHETTTRLLEKLGYHNVHITLGDGSRGWPEEAPFDGIIITAAAPRVPEQLISQLRVGRHMIVPVVTMAGWAQELQKITRTETGHTAERLYDVRFVPMKGEIDKS